MHQELHAELASRPGNVPERVVALRDFTRKHRLSIGCLATYSVRSFYASPCTSDPIATARVREDVLFIHLRSRPNAQRTRLETRFFVRTPTSRPWTGYPKPGV